MKIAFAVWDGRISPVFDVARQIIILEIENGRIISKSKEALAEEDPVEKAGKLARLQIKTLVCGGISRPLAGMLAVYGIQTIPFIAGDLEQTIEAFMAGALPNPILGIQGCCPFCKEFRVDLGESDKEKTISGRKCSEQERRKIMPRGDRTGPQGQGPGTGRGLGPCGKKVQKPADKPDSQGRGMGKGQGKGRGKGRGLGRGRNQ